MGREGREEEGKEVMEREGSDGYCAVVNFP